jgi:hypothetical protein
VGVGILRSRRPEGAVSLARGDTEVGGGDTKCGGGLYGRQLTLFAEVCIGARSPRPGTTASASGRRTSQGSALRLRASAQSKIRALLTVGDTCAQLASRTFLALTACPETSPGKVADMIWTRVVCFQRLPLPQGPALLLNLASGYPPLHSWLAAALNGESDLSRPRCLLKKQTSLGGLVGAPAHVVRRGLHRCEVAQARDYGFGKRPANETAVGGAAASKRSKQDAGAA